MTQNLISLTLTAADLADLDAALTTVEQKLSGLIALSAGERRSLTKMGDKSEAFCRQTLAVLSQNPNVIPPSFDLHETQSDLANIDLLRPRFARLRRLVEKADDSETALGSDVMTAALEGYALLKLSGHNQGLDGLRQMVSSRFARAPRTLPNGSAPGAPTAAS